MVWVIGAVIATSGTYVMLEFGAAIPRSGGIKNYLERSLHSKLLLTCVFIFYCVFLQVSGGNAITFSSYILKAADVEATTWRLRSLAMAGTAFAVGTHIVVPNFGRRLQDVLSAVKLFILLFIVCCGFAALAGHLQIEKPDNFHNAFQGTSRSGYNIGAALLNVMYSYQGYDNLNAVRSPLLIAEHEKLTSFYRSYQKSSTLRKPYLELSPSQWAPWLCYIFSQTLPM